MSAPALARPAFLQDLDTIRVLWSRDLMRFLRQPSRIIGAIGQPILFWIIIGSGLTSSFRLPGAEGVSYLQYFFPGVLAMTVLFASIFSTVSVIEDRHNGFLQTVMVSPGSRMALVVGKAAGAATVAMLQAMLLLVFTPWAGFSVGEVHWPALVLVLALTSAALTTFGIALAWWLDNFQAYHAIMMVLLMPLWVISGAMFPVPDGGILGTLLRLNPLAFAVDGVRLALYGGSFPEQAAAGLSLGSTMVIDLAVLAGATVLALAFAGVMVSRR